MAGSPTRVKGLDPSRPTPARLTAASRSSSRPARRDSLAEASARARGLASAEASAVADGGLRVAEAWPEAALRLVPSETSAWAVPGTRTLARMPVLRLARPASALALVPEPRQLPTSPDRTGRRRRP